MGKPTFKSYYQDQLMAFPPSLEEIVPKNHTVRVVNDIINQINLDVLKMNMKRKDVQAIILVCF